MNSKGDRQRSRRRGGGSTLRVIACKRERIDRATIVYPSWHKGLIGIESNVIRLIYQVCTKCALCNSIPRCVRLIKKRTNDTPPSSSLPKPSMEEGSHVFLCVCLLWNVINKKNRFHPLGLDMYVFQILLSVPLRCY